MLSICFGYSRQQRTVVGGEAAGSFVVLVQADDVIRSESEVSHLLPLLSSLCDWDKPANLTLSVYIIPSRAPYYHQICLSEMVVQGFEQLWGHLLKRSKRAPVRIWIKPIWFSAVE
jgi:hypothetical protein